MPNFMPGNPTDGSDAAARARIFSGGLLPPADARTAAAGENILGMLPDAITLACGDAALAVTPTGSGQQDIEVGRWVMPYDAGIISNRLELVMPNVARCTACYLRTSVAQINTLAQNTHIVSAFDPFIVQLSGTAGVKRHIYDPMMMFFRRVPQGQIVIASLQVFTTAGAAFNVEYYVQMRIAKFGALLLSGN